MKRCGDDLRILRQWRQGRHPWFGTGGSEAFPSGGGRTRFHLLLPFVLSLNSLKLQLSQVFLQCCSTIGIVGG